MHIVHVVYSLSHGGIGTIVGEIANIQANNNFVEIIVLSDIVATEKLKVLKKGIKVHLLNRKTGCIAIKAMIRLNWLLFRSKASIIHFHAGEIRKYLFPLVWSKIKNKSCVTIHCIESHVESIRKHRIADFIYRFSISAATAASLLSLQQLESVVVVNGIDVSKFRNADKTKGGEFRIIQIGRLDYNVKGQDLLIQAVAKLKRQGCNGWTVSFLGGVDNNQNALLNLAKEHGVDDKITFIPPQAHKYIEDHLCEYNLLVMPSRSEGFGLTAAEAMAAKIPVLVSNLPALADVVDNGNAGFIFESENVDDLANKIKMFIEGGNFQNVVNNAFKRVSSLYGIENTVKNYMIEYKKIMSAL